MVFSFVFFFQAEDGIRDYKVTGVQTCALPIYNELCYFRIGRDVSDSNDDMAGDCRLHGVKLFYTTDASNDA